MTKTKYAQDGVDVEEEASFSSYAGGICKETYQNSTFVNVIDLSEGKFRGPRPFELQNLPEGYITEMSSDGIGTKSILTDAAKNYEDIAYDLTAMVTSDITRYGGIPLVMTNVLDVNTVGTDGDSTRESYKALLRGLGKASADASIVTLKGETAQMGVCMGSEIQSSPTKFNWSATLLGAYTKDKMVTGNTIKEGQVIIALKEQGFRCNGISSVRAALRKEYGDAWWENAEAKSDIIAAAAPSILYDTFVNTLHGWYAKDFVAEVTLHGIVHISGGGIKEKLGNDMLASRGLSANLDNLFELPSIMRKCAQWRGLSDEESIQRGMVAKACF